MYKVEASAGQTINSAIDDAIESAKSIGRPVELEFNGTFLVIDSFSVAKDVQELFWDERAKLDEARDVKQSERDEIQALAEKMMLAAMAAQHDHRPFGFWLSSAEQAIKERNEWRASR